MQVTNTPIETIETKQPLHESQPQLNAVEDAKKTSKDYTSVRREYRVSRLVQHVDTP